MHRVRRSVSKASQVAVRLPNASGARGSVEAGGRLVEDEEPAAAEESTGHVESLALSTGEGAATLSDACVVTVREPTDEVVGIGASSGFGDLGGGGVGSGERDVLRDGRVGQQHLLGDDGDRGADGTACGEGKIVVAQQN